MKAQSYQPDDVKKVHYPGSLPSYIPPDEQQKLIKQARLHSADAASVPQAGKSPPPGFASTNGFAGPSEARAGQVAPSPDRGRQTSGEPLPSDRYVTSAYVCNSCQMLANPTV